jgi:3-methylfumaryl-CoA hydratase
MSIAPEMDLDHLRTWVGRTEVLDDLLSPWTASALAATLRNANTPWQTGDVLPPLWHWCYFLPTTAQDQLGADGHAVRGHFLPPVPLPRRMWAGSRLEFMAPLTLGLPARKTSRVASVDVKQGRQGPLVFVRVAHEIHHPQGPLLLRDTHDIVYREAAKPGEAATMKLPPEAPAWTHEHHLHETLLFRYSALTFNSHRIHYDHPYATQEEGYAHLVVHGPLIATLLLEVAQQHNPGRRVTSFEFRAVRPLVCHQLLRLRGHLPDADGRLTLWAEDAQGWLLMQANATLVATG